MKDLQACVRIQRIHPGVPAVVVDSVSLCHPQHWTLEERRQTNTNHKTRTESREYWWWTWTINWRSSSLQSKLVREPVAPCQEYDTVQFLTPLTQDLVGPYCITKCHCFCSVIPKHYQTVIHLRERVNDGDLQSNIYLSCSLRLECFCSQLILTQPVWQKKVRPQTTGWWPLLAMPQNSKGKINPFKKWKNTSACCCTIRWKQN